jgi:acetyltransferase-like isoleucine patch superfamily enzyme
MGGCVYLSFDSIAVLGGLAPPAVRHRITNLLQRSTETTIHPSADVAESASIGKGTRIWHQAQVREQVVIGSECILGKGVYVDLGVRIGDRCKLENGAFVFHGYELEDGVFIGPGAMLLNDKNPRAINPDGTLKTESDWTASSGIVRRGAAVGGGAVLLPGVEVGSFALVGSGAVVTRDVPAHGIVVGNPARLVGYACSCGRRLPHPAPAKASAEVECPACGRTISIGGPDGGGATGS